MILPIVVVCVVVVALVAWVFGRRRGKGGRRIVRPTKVKRVGVIGQGGAGKTSLIEEVAPEKDENGVNSIAFGTTEFKVIEGATEKCDGFVFVIDASQKSDPRDVWMTCMEKIRDKPTLILANKADVAGAKRYVEIEDLLGLSELLCEEIDAKWPIKMTVGTVHAKFGFRNGLKWLAEAIECKTK